MGDMEATDPPAEVAPEAPSIATVTGDATALLADLAALDILLMLLLETQANADTPQLVDGIDIDPLIERVAELITEIQGLVSDLMSDPDGDPAAATEALAEKRAEIEQLQQTVAALNSDAPVDDTNGPTIATTTADANTLIDELGALDARLMALLGNAGRRGWPAIAGRCQRWPTDRAGDGIDHRKFRTICPMF